MSGFEISNSPGREAPEFDEGLVPAKFIGLAKVNHPEWAQAQGKYGPDNGDRIHWRFVLTDDEGEEFYNDEGEQAEVEGVNGTNFNTKSEKSKNAAWLKAVSPAAFAKVDAGMGVDPAELENAPVMLLLERKENGWPKIVNVLPKATRRASRRTATSGDAG